MFLMTWLVQSCWVAEERQNKVLLPNALPCREHLGGKSQGPNDLTNWLLTRQQFDATSWDTLSRIVQRHCALHVPETCVPICKVRWINFSWRLVSGEFFLIKKHVFYVKFREVPQNTVAGLGGAWGPQFPDFGCLVPMIFFRLTWFFLFQFPSAKPRFSQPTQRHCFPFFRTASWG